MLIVLAISSNPTMRFRIVGEVLSAACLIRLVSYNCIRYR